jgi:hypothetical protein
MVAGYKTEVSARMIWYRISEKYGNKISNWDTAKAVLQNLPKSDTVSHPLKQLRLTICEILVEDQVRTLEELVKELQTRRFAHVTSKGTHDILQLLMECGLTQKTAKDTWKSFDRSKLTMKRNNTELSASDAILVLKDQVGSTALISALEQCVSTEPQPLDKKFTCDLCSFCSVQAIQLDVHKRTHTGEKPYTCDFEGCKASFAQSGGLSSHQRVHTGERPFTCDFEGCDRRFSGSSGLNQHQLSHTGEKPYVCEVCDTGFTAFSSLMTHMRAHTGEKPYICEECNEGYATSSALVVHTRTHTGEKPYICEECGKGCTTSGSLVTHMRTHTGEKPYICEECGKGCTTSGSLVFHTRTHTGEKPFICHDCNACFTQSGQRNTHIAVYHVRCQSEACAVYDISERNPGTHGIDGKRFCVGCASVLYPNKVKVQIRKEHQILAEIQRLVPELAKASLYWQWDCRVPGGCSLKRPDMLYVLSNCYLQLEIDENGHENTTCTDEDSRLELIAADVGLPGIVIRINPDSSPPMLKRRKLSCGELSWQSTPQFSCVMEDVATFARQVLARTEFSTHLEQRSFP